MVFFEQKMMTTRCRRLLQITGLLTLLAAPAMAETVYVADFEQTGEARFACAERSLEKQTVYDLKQAEAMGMVKINSLERSKFLEYNRSGVHSLLFDVTVDKTDPQSGGLCMFTGGDLKIPVTGDLYFTGYLLPVDVPPDVFFIMGISFTFDSPDNGRRVSGSQMVFRSGVTADGWIVFQKNIRELVRDFKNPVITGWMVQIRSDRAFHGQHVKFAVDDISLDTVMPAVNASADGETRPQAIRANDPYIVNYRSLYDECPADRVNLVKNGSFELGLTGFYPYVTREYALEKSPSMPDPDRTFAVVDDPNAPDGDRILRVSRPDGGNHVSVRTTPVPVRDGADYVLSFYADTDRPVTLTVTGKTVTLTPGWKRYVLDFPNMASYSAFGKRFPGRAELLFEETSAANWAIDAIQFQKAPLGAYTPAAMVELTARPEARFGLVGENEALRYQIECYNSSAKTVTSTVDYEIQNLYKQKITGDRRTVTLAPGKREIWSVATPKNYNYSRLSVKLNAPDQPEQTFVTSAAAIPDLTQIAGNEFFGSCAVEGDNAPNLKRELELNKRLGMYFNVVYGINLNSEANWKQNAQSRWQRIDAILDFHDQAKMKAVLQDELIFPHAPPVAPTPELSAMLRDYCRAKAERTRGRVLAHNIFGEYMKFPLEERLPLMASVIEAARAGFGEGDAATPLWAAGQDHMDTILTTYAALQSTGAFDKVDAASIHPYSWGRDAAGHEAMLKLIALLNGRKLAGTEGGSAAADTLYWDDIAGESGVYTHVVTELQQAEYDIALNLMMLGSKAFIHNATFYPYEGGMQFRRYYHHVNDYNNLSPRPIFPAYAQMVRRLSGAEVTGEVEQRKQSGLQGYLFRKDNRPFAVLWRYDEYGKSVKMSIPLKSGMISAYNLVGETIALPPGGDVNFDLGRGAVYLYPAAGCTDAQFENAVRQIRTLQPRLSVRPTATGAELEAVNCLDQPLTGKLVSAALGIDQNIRLAAGETKVVKAKKLDLPVNGEPVAATLGDLPAAPVRLMQAVHAPPAVTVDGDLSEFKNAVFYVPDPQKPLSLCRCENTGAKYLGPNDLSGRLALLWDDKYLYLGAEVCDDIAAAPHTDPALFWANDALHLSLVMSGRLDDSSLDNLLELAICANGVSAVLEGNRKPDLSGVKTAVIRRGDRTFYEAAIPWQTLAPKFVPGKSPAPGFNFSLSDNDNIIVPGAPQALKGYQKALQFNSGIADRKSAGNAALLIFTTNPKGDL